MNSLKKVIKKTIKTNELFFESKRNNEDNKSINFSNKINIFFVKIVINLYEFFFVHDFVLLFFEEKLYEYIRLKTI